MFCILFYLFFVVIGNDKDVAIARLDPEKLAGGQLFRLSRLQRPLVQWMQWKQQQSTEQDERLFALWTQVAFQMVSPYQKKNVPRKSDATGGCRH